MVNDSSFYRVVKQHTSDAWSILSYTTMKPKHIHIGTSGWHYRHWRNVFYPPDIPVSNWLSHYASQFNTVEINCTFYKLPEIKEIKDWHACVPSDFLFSVKASRYITHMKKLSDTDQEINKFLKRISLLGEKLGPILFQLPPKWHFNNARLTTFLSSLSSDFRYAFEFRDQSWHNDDTYELLKSHQIAFCIFDMDGHVSSKSITTDFSYIRLHGPSTPYSGSYNDAELSLWSENIRNYLNSGVSVYCYFNNDQFGYALKNAQALLSDIISNLN